VHPEPASVQVTPFAAESFDTVAVNVAVAAFRMLALVGEIVTAIAAFAVMEIVVEADLVESATEVAVSVTVAGLGVD
jgi:hypothetical protein